MRPLTFIVVLSVFILLYGALHYYAYQKLGLLFVQQRRLLALVLLLLFCSVFLVEALSHTHNTGRISAVLSHVAFFWMGLVFLFFCFSLPFDLLSLLARLFGLRELQSVLRLPAISLLVAVLVAGVSVYGFLAARQVTVERLELTSNRLTQPLRIVQISDLHLGQMSSVGYFTRVVERINSLQPDLIVSTGDLVDMQLDHMTELEGVMSGLRARLGKYAVYGNHEVFAGLDASRRFTENLGFVILSNAGISIDRLINLVGVDDPAVARFEETRGPGEMALLQQYYGNGLLTLLLKHQPILHAGSQQFFDLQLSGHIHGGQIFPFGLLTRIFYRLPVGLTALEGQTWLYVSRGTGTWGPPMRVLAPPEITLIEIMPTQKK